LAELAQRLGLTPGETGEAIAFLIDHRMIDAAGAGRWTTGDDPWEMLTAGLAERRKREVGPALETLRECHRLAREEDRRLGLRIGKLLNLAEDLAAIDAQASRISPGLMRSLLGLSGRAARLIDRSANRRTKP
jgi:hypothetical protein